VVSARTGRVSIPRLAEGIRTARGQAGLSQAELATQLGIGQSSVGQWERGATTPTLVMFHRIVAVVGPWPLLEVLLPPDQPLSAAILERTADQPVGRPDPQEQARLVDQGHSNLEIGRRYGAPAAAVSQWREAAGLPPAIPRRRPSPRELADLVAEGLSDETIGHRYGRSAETVAKWCQADSRRRPRGWPSPQELAGLVARGLSDLQIGQRYGVVSGTVKLWRYEAELLRYHPSKRPSPQTLARLVAEGLTDRAIGQRYGKSPQTVVRWRLADGLVRQRATVEVDVARVQELRGQGLPIPDVAATLGYTPSQVSRASRTARTTGQQGTPLGSASPGSTEGGEADPQGRQ